MRCIIALALALALPLTGCMTAPSPTASLEPFIAGPGPAAAAADLSRDVIGVANASDVAVEVWLATEGTGLGGPQPRWYVDGPWKLPPGALWLHGQAAHERTLASHSAGDGAAAPPRRLGDGRAFVCVCYADEPEAPRAWAEVTAGGLGIRRPPFSPELTFIHMPRSMDEALREVPPAGSPSGLAADALPTAPRQSAEVRVTAAGLALPLQAPTIVLDPSPEHVTAAAAAPSRNITPVRYVPPEGGR